MEVAGWPLGLCAGNLHVLWGLLDGLWGCRLATYRSYGGCRTAIGAVGWQPTGLIGVAGWPLGLYVGNLHGLWGLLAFGAVGWQPTGLVGVAGWPYGGCWTVFGAVCWQPTGLVGVAGWPLGLYVGNLQV